MGSRRYSSVRARTGSRTSSRRAPRTPVEVDALPQIATGQFDLGKLEALAAESRRLPKTEPGRAPA
jgi:hypothetical protein